MGIYIDIFFFCNFSIFEREKWGFWTSFLFWGLVQIYPNLACLPKNSTCLVIRDRHQTLGPTASHTTRRGRRLLVNPSPRIQINWLFLVFFVLRGSKWRPWLLQLPQLESCGIIAFLSSASLFCLNPRDIQGKVSVYLWVLLYEFWLSACEGFQEQTSKHLSSFTPNADKSQLSGLDVTGSACWCCMSEISL